MLNSRSARLIPACQNRPHAKALHGSLRRQWSPKSGPQGTKWKDTPVDLYCSKPLRSHSRPTVGRLVIRIGFGRGSGISPPGIVIRTIPGSTYLSVDSYIHLSTNQSIYLYTCSCTCIYHVIYIYIYIHTPYHTQINKCVNMCAHVYIYIYIRTHMLSSDPVQTSIQGEPPAGMAKLIVLRRFEGFEFRGLLAFGFDSHTLAFGLGFGVSGFVRLWVAVAVSAPQN